MATASDVLSVDVEDYYHVEAFSDVVARAAWDAYPSRVVDNTHRILDLLAEHDTRATFFILGWVAERFPKLVRDLVREGHEPACHSYWHRLVYALSPEEFREDTRRAKAAIEDAAGRPIHGYRAPSYSVTRRSLWALEILAEEGFTYDSSIFPIRHDVYGIPDAPRHPVRLSDGGKPFTEFPLTTFRLAPFGTTNLPVAGGGYLRMLPFWYTRLGVRRVHAEGRPVIAYLHPWELDPPQPRITGRWRSRLRHYSGLATMPARVKGLLGLGRFSSFEASGLLAASHPSFHSWRLLT